MRAPRDGVMQGAPCLLLLHGVGANEAGLADLAARQDPRLAVILVQAPLMLGPQQYAWFQVSFTADGPKINPAQAEQSRQTLLAFIAGLPAAYGVDARRVFIGGFSQGGIMSASVALTQPDAVAGFAILSGRILPEIAPLTASPSALQGLHGFVSHGTHDSKLTVAYARSAQRLLTDNTVQLSYHEYAADHELNDAMQRDFGLWLAQRLDATE